MNYDNVFVIPPGVFVNSIEPLIDKVLPSHNNSSPVNPFSIENEPLPLFPLIPKNTPPPTLYPCVPVVAPWSIEM